MSNEECVFCKIISGEIPARKLTEGRFTLAILDAFPATLGHTLIIPKKHHADISTMSKEELSEVMEQMQLLADAITTVTSSSGYNLLNNTGEIAGQLVKHAHFHIIPRTEDDGFEMKFGKVELNEGEKDELAEAIKENI